MTIALTSVAFGGWQWYRAVEQRNETATVNAELKAYSKLLEQTLSGMNSFMGGGRNVTMGEFMKKAVNLYNKNKTVSHRQMSYHAQILAKIYNSWGEYLEELKIIESGYNYALKTESPLDEIIFLGQKAVTFHNLSQFKLAIRTAKEAIKEADKYPNLPTQKLGILNYLAHSLIATEQYGDAKKAFLLLKNSPNSTKKNKAFSYYGIATIELSLYDFEESIKNFKVAIPLFSETLGKKSGFVLMINALNLYVETLLNPQDYNSIDYKQMAKKINQMFGEKHTNTAEFIQMNANALFLNGQIEQAIKLQKKALSKMESIGINEFILRSKLPLIKLHIGNGEIEKANIVLKSISSHELTTMSKQSMKAEYHIYKLISATLTNDFSLATKEKEIARLHLKGTEIKSGKGELYYREAQLNALEKNYQSCYDNAKKATDMATKLYPKTWQLPNAYRYLQDVCQQKLEGRDNTEFPYLQAVLDSPWKQETVITSKILNSN